MKRIKKGKETSCFTHPLSECTLRVNAVQINAITAMKRPWFFGKAVVAPKHWTLLSEQGCSSAEEGAVFGAMVRPEGHQPPMTAQHRLKASQ